VNVSLGKSCQPFGIFSCRLVFGLAKLFPRRSHSKFPRKLKEIFFNVCKALLLLNMELMISALCSLLLCSSNLSSFKCAIDNLPPLIHKALKGSKSFK